MPRSLLRWFPFFLACCSLSAGGPAIEHLEPMHWWVGMKDPRLQLMVHGRLISELEPSVSYPGITLVSVERTDNPNYVFLNLVLAPETRPGEVTLSFRRDGETALTHTYRLEERRPGSAERKGFDSSSAIYLLMPDRFSSGRHDNDTVAGMLEAADRNIPTSRHGGDLAGIQQHLGYIASLGFTHVWPTPLMENNQPAYSYHGYAMTDLYRVDPRFGSNEDYRAMVQEARSHGLGVLQDIVLNHIGTGHWWMRDLPSSNWLNHQGAPRMTNNIHFTIPDIHAAEEDRALFVQGWFDTSMADMNQRNPLLARYLIQNTIWWIEYADLSGIREDTLSYSEKHFVHDWSTAVLREYPNLNIVGEEMNEPPHLTAYWQKGANNRDGYDSGVPAITDFPVSDLIAPALLAPANSPGGFAKLYETIAADHLYADPMNLLVFPDNHDRPRVLASLRGNTDLLKSALLFTATTRGIPQIFYGTEVLISSPVERNDGLLRADFPGGWPGDRVNAFTGANLSAAQRETQDFVRRLFSWRRSSEAIGKGILIHFVPESGFYVYFRSAGKSRVMVVLNQNRTDTTLSLGRFARLIGGAKSGRNPLTGETVSLEGELRLPALKSLAVEFTFDQP